MKVVTRRASKEQRHLVKSAEDSGFKLVEGMEVVFTVSPNESSSEVPVVIVSVELPLLEELYPSVGGEKNIRAYCLMRPLDALLLAKTLENQIEVDELGEILDYVRKELSQKQ